MLVISYGVLLMLVQAIWDMNVEGSQWASLSTNAIEQVTRLYPHLPLSTTMCDPQRCWLPPVGRLHMLALFFGLGSCIISRTSERPFVQHWMLVPGSAQTSSFCGPTHVFLRLRSCI